MLSSSIDNKEKEPRGGCHGGRCFKKAQDDEKRRCSTSARRPAFVEPSSKPFTTRRMTTRPPTSTAAQAVASLRSGVPPDYTYLLRNRFRVLVDRKVTTASAKPVTYYAVDYEGLLRFQSNPYGKDPAASAVLEAFLIPTTPGSKLVAKNGSFPLNTFATIDLAHQTGFGVICNEQLTGCTVAFGWDKSTSRLYVGHAEPDDKIEAISTRAKLSDYLRKHGAFQGVKLSQSEILLVGGSRKSWSDYPDDKANVIGFVTKNADGKYAVTIIVQVEKADGKIRESWKMDFDPAPK